MDTNKYLVTVIYHDRYTVDIVHSVEIGLEAAIKSSDIDKELWEKKANGVWEANDITFRDLKSTNEFRKMRLKIATIIPLDNLNIEEFLSNHYFGETNSKFGLFDTVDTSYVE